MPEGTVLGGRYILGEVLGTGGMADVYRAEDRTLDRAVAVKMMRATTADRDRARFADEARTLASLNHPGLVTILDTGIEDEQPYLVMELVQGPTLAAHIQEHGPLDQAKAASIGTQLGAALAYAHSNGVVHRDVKPSNILLCSDDRVVLTDFGIARLLANAEQHTRTGETIGSPAYLAPEQVTGEPPTTAVDVYSLGLVLLEALTASRAYPGPPIEAAVARLTTGPVIPVSLGREWLDVLGGMIVRDPELRPTAAQVVESLTTVIGGMRPSEATRLLELPTETVAMAVVSDPASPGDDRHPNRSRILLALAGFAAIAIVVCSLALMDPDPGTADRQPPDPSATPSASSRPTVPTAQKTTPSPTTSPVRVAKKKAVGPASAEKHGKGKGKGKKPHRR